MNDYIIKIKYVIEKFKINLKWYNVIETTSFFKFNFSTNSMINEIMKYEKEFQSILGNGSWLESKNGLIGLCIPKNTIEILPLENIIESEFYQNYQSPLKIAIGENVNGEIVLGDLLQWNHILIGGVTRAGKSNLLNIMIHNFIQNDTSILRLFLIDLKRVELVRYKHIPHLLKPIITDINEVTKGLYYLINEMKIRYEILEKANVRNIQGYQQKGLEMPYIILIIDELSNIILESEDKEIIEKYLIRLASMGGACGIHLILATQKPSSQIITTDLKSNIETRIAFKTASHYDSMVILDEVGAENLRGKGELIINDRDGLQRAQCCYITDDEIERNLKGYDKLIEIEEIEEIDEIEEEIGEVEIETEFSKAYKKAVCYVKENGECNQWQLRKLLNKGIDFCDSIIKKLIDDNMITSEKVGKVYKLKGE